MPGVRKIAQVPSGVAVIADTFWQAKVARDALRVEWVEGVMQTFSTSQMMQQFREKAKTPGASVRKEGDAATSLAGAAKKIEAVYEVPYLSHLMMEPLNCVVDLGRIPARSGPAPSSRPLIEPTPRKPPACPMRKFSCTLRSWAEASAGARPAVGLRGRGGSRCESNRSSSKSKGCVDARRRYAGRRYRPAFLHALEGGVDANGTAVSFTSRSVGQSIMKGTPFEAMMGGKPYDPASVEGIDDLPYSIQYTVESNGPEVNVPVQWLRSVGHSHTAFAVECFMDELAGLAQKDPYQFRRDLLLKQPRYLGVLDLAAKKSGWGKPLPKGMGRGIAVHFAFGSYLAHVAEVSVTDGKIKVHRMVCAVDCGQYSTPGLLPPRSKAGPSSALRPRSFRSSPSRTGACSRPISTLSRFCA